MGEESIQDIGEKELKEELNPGQFLLFLWVIRLNI